MGRSVKMKNPCSEIADKIVLGPPDRCTLGPGPKELTWHAVLVRAFMEKAGQELPGSPTVPGGKIRVRSVRLLFEELLEFAKASGVEVRLLDDYDSPPLTFGELEFAATDEVDLVAAADGLADIAVVNTGAMLAFGIADHTLLAEVDRNNLAKFSAGGYKDKHGKWRKPPDHQPPDIAKVLRDQGLVYRGGNSDEEAHQVHLPGKGNKQRG